MVTMRMMQVPIDQIINVVAMGHRLVAASWTMDMIRIMTAAGMPRCAVIRISIAHFHSVLFDLTIGPDVMKMSVVQIINMVTMLDGGVPAVRPVLMIVIAVQIRHF